MSKISVIIAVYNVERYIQQCLDSLLAQTLSDIQIICVDDCSTDNSLNILNQYAQKDSRIEIVSMRNSIGPGVARNEGLKHVKGEYITFIDSDDWILPDYLMNLYQKAVETNADLVETGNMFCKKGRLVPNNAKLLDFKMKTTGYDWKEMGEYIFSDLMSWCKLYKASLIIDNGIYFSHCISGEDNIFVVKSRIFSEKIAFLDKQEYIYRLRMSSIGRTLQTQFYSLIVKQDFDEFFKETELYNVLETYYTDYFSHLCFACHDSILPELRAEYDNKLKQELSEDIYNKYREKLNESKKFSLARWVFSLRNKVYDDKEAYKIIVIFGIEFRLFRIYEK